MGNTEMGELVNTAWHKWLFTDQMWAGESRTVLIEAENMVAAVAECVRLAEAGLIYRWR